MTFGDDSDGPSDAVARQYDPHLEDSVSDITKDIRLHNHFSDFRSFLFGRQQQMAAVRVAYDSALQGNPELYL
jgi:hypothetical protein